MAITKQNIPSDDLSTFGARLRHAREEQGLSRPELSQQTNKTLSARVIGHLEDGITEPTITRLQVLADALNIDTHWLQYGGDTELDTRSDIEPDNHSLNECATSPHQSEPVPTIQNQPVKAHNSAFESTNSTIQHYANTAESRPLSDEKPTEVDQSRPSSTGTGPSRKYMDKMENILHEIDLFREDGLQNHPRKMPKLTQKAMAVGATLEFSDIEFLANERSIILPDFNIDEYDEEEQEALLCEFVLRLIDTAAIGIDLYTLDMDTLNIFRRKHTDVGRPLFVSWNEPADLVPELRETYWQKAMQGSLAVSTSLRDM